jgi:sialate O-acetylesterase
MVTNWRTDWGQGDFPFLQVQLAPFTAIREEPGESNWAELREAQVLATKRLRKVGAVSITDVGDPKDIHPAWKRPVGERLALAARRIAYGEKLTHTGPMYRGMKVKGDKVVLSFDHVGEGLGAAPVSEEKVPGATRTAGLIVKGSPLSGRRDAPLHGFAIAGEDRKFVWADAVIDGDKVVVSSAKVPQPVAVRYGWADYPVVNLVCSPGGGLPALPATPFRTDDWPMMTAPKPPAR